MHVVIITIKRYYRPVCELASHFASSICALFCKILIVKG